jgi:threonine dehydratase
VVLDTRLVVEPAGAAAVAAITSGRVKLAPDGSTVAVLTGGNLDASRLAGWLETKKSPGPTVRGPER